MLTSSKLLEPSNGLVAADGHQRSDQLLRNSGIPAARFEQAPNDRRHGCMLAEMREPLRSRHEQTGLFRLIEMLQQQSPHSRCVGNRQTFPNRPRCEVRQC